MTLNQSMLDSDRLSILSPWLMNAKIVPTMTAILIARATTVLESATVKKLWSARLVVVGLFNIFLA